MYALFHDETGGSYWHTPSNWHTEKYLYELIIELYYSWNEDHPCTTGFAGWHYQLQNEDGMYPAFLLSRLSKGAWMVTPFSTRYRFRPRGEDTKTVSFSYRDAFLTTFQILQPVSVPLFTIDNFPALFNYNLDRPSGAELETILAQQASLDDTQLQNEDGMYPAFLLSRLSKCAWMATPFSTL
jgi:hypothetical protein